MKRKQRIVVTLSGGKASAWCAAWALKNYPKEDVVLYFNDTKWEDPDLYRFMDDLSKYLDHPITEDSDGRSPEDLFMSVRALANDLMPFCSKVLKAERLQKWYQDGDILIFGIGVEEQARAKRIVRRYQTIASKTGKYPKLLFPLISEQVAREQVDQFFLDIGIRTPRLYDLGFSHNNCGGGCVRAGKASWKRLLEKLPMVYQERERVERRVRELTGKDIHFLKDETLEDFRKRCHSGELSRHYEEDGPIECMGMCVSYNWNAGVDFCPPDDS